MNQKVSTAAESAGSNLGNDLLHGVGPIGEFIGCEKRKTYYLLEQGQIPAGKLGATWVASKKKLAQYFSNVTSGGGK